MKQEIAIYTRTESVPGKPDRISQERVQVLARGGGYALVRNPGCYPFAVPDRLLSDPQPKDPPQ